MNGRTFDPTPQKGLPTPTLLLDSFILQFYSGGIYDTIHCSSTSLNHAMVVIGYGSQNGKHYWTVKNR